MSFDQLVVVAIAILVGPAVYLVVAQQQYLRAHQKHHRAFASEEDRLRLLGSDPIRAIRALPGETGAHLTAYLTPEDDPRLEGLRRRALVATAGGVVAILGCVPLALVLDGVVRRVTDGRIPVAGVAAGAGALIGTVVSALFLIRNRHAQESVRTFAIVVGLSVAAAVALTFAMLGYVHL